MGTVLFGSGEEGKVKTKILQEIGIHSLLLLIVIIVVLILIITAKIVVVIIVIKICNYQEGSYCQ